ncbi:MAG: hypothetical protein HOP11_00490 [Saprospiraceae bacterium]|nr:hypothetical protein [Saprospiraceae bacterium]
MINFIQLLLKPISVKLQESIRNAVQICDDNSLEHIHIVENNQYIGTLSKDQIEELDPELKISEEKKSATHCSIDAEEKLILIWSKFIQNKISSIAIQRDNVYLGSLSFNDFIRVYESEFNIEGQGSWIICVNNKINYSLSQLSAIADEHHSSIQHLFQIESENNEEIMVSFRLNTQETENIINSLNRHNLEVILVHNSNEHQEPLRERYDELMHYLNV